MASRDVGVRALWVAPMSSPMLPLRSDLRSPALMAALQAPKAGRFDRADRAAGLPVASACRLCIVNRTSWRRGRWCHWRWRFMARVVVDGSTEQEGT